MRLFRLTIATIFQRKTWAIYTLAIIALPFALPYISSATEKPVLVQPARIQAAWATLGVCALIWGFFTAAREGESNAKSGIGEYFQTTGLGPGRQLFQIWLAIMCFIVPMVILTALICVFGAMPSNPAEKSMWLILTAQYAALFILVVAPLLALSTAIASRFGSISGFGVTILLTLYGLYGVGYLDSMLKIEENPFFRALLYFSPQYRFADLTQRLYFKSGALTSGTFITMLLYFGGICLIYAAISRVCFRTKNNS